MLWKIFFLILIPILSWAQFLEVGQSQFYPAAPDAKIKVTPAKLVEIQEKPEGIELKAKVPGKLQLQIGTNVRNIRILASGTKSFHQKMLTLSGEMLGPNITFREGRVQVVGNIHRLSDWKKFIKLSAQMNQKYELKAKIDEDLHLEFKKEIKKLLRSVGVHSFHLSFIPYPVLKLSEEDQGLEIHEALKFTGLTYSTSKEQLSMKALVDIRIVVAEVTGSFQSDLGIDWPTQFSAQVNNRFRSHEQLMATLKLAEAQGKGQVLASPHVVAKSGGQAEFLAGGELPIRIMSRYTKGIQWKRHGIFLKIQPRADQDQNISLKLEAEVSMPDSGYSVDNIPAMKTNRVSSQFDIRAKSTIVLSGLIQNMKSLNDQSLAGLSRLPIIGSFFKSRSRRETQTELVIFVTPEIRKNPVELKPKAPKTWEGRFEYF